MDKSNGAPSNFMNALCFDQEGRALLATDIGLYSYNGTIYKQLVRNTFVNQVRCIENSIYYTVENELYQLGKKEPIANIPENEVIIDFQLRKVGFSILSQNHYFEFQEQNIITKIDVDNPIKLISGSNDGLFLVQREKISSIKNKKLRTLFKADDEIFDASLSGKYFALTFSDSWQLFNAKSFSKIKTFNCSEIRSISNYGSSGFVVSGAKEIQLFKNGRIESLTQPELFDNVETTMVDQYLGAWFLTQGEGLFFVPNFDLRQGENSSISASHSDNKIFYHAHEKYIQSSNGDQITTSERALSIDSWNGKLIYTTATGCYIQDGNGFVLISNEELSDIIIDEANNLLYGRTESNGIQVINLVSKDHHFITVADGLSHNYIKSWTALDNMIVAMPKRGKLNFIRNGKLIQTSLFEEKDIPQSQIIRSSGNQDALLFYNVNGSLTILYPSDKENVILQVIPSAREAYVIEGKLILIGNTNVEILNLSSLQRITFDLPKNLSNSIIGNGYILEDSMLKLGTSGGILSIGLNDLDRKTRKPNLVIAELLINGKSKDLNNSFELDYGENIIRIRSEFIDLSNSYSSSLIWKMTGSRELMPSTIKDEWIEFIVFNDGEYQVEFQHQNLDLNKKVSFVVNPPIWKRIWFWVLVVLAFALITILLIRWRTYRLRREKEKLEKIFNKRTKELQSRNEDVEQIAYALSHDFKVPLNSIESLIGLLKRDDIPNEHKTQTIELLGSKSEKLSKNMERLIELIKIENNQSKFVSIDLAQIVSEVLTSTEQLIEEKKAYIRLDLACDLELKGIPSFVFSIIHNLITNALKYSKKEEAPIIAISSFDEEGNFVIEIHDNGIGIDLSSGKQKIFHPFKQVDPQSPGVGLGLSIVKRMVEIHGGEISIQSQLNHGTTFKIAIPVNS